MKSLANELCEIFAGHYMKGEPTDRAWSAVARYVRRLVREAREKAYDMGLEVGYIAGEKIPKAQIKRLMSADIDKCRQNKSRRTR